MKKFEDIIPLEDGWEILSDDGYHPVTNICKTHPYNVWLIKTADNELRCADNHIVFNSQGEGIHVCDVKAGDMIYTCKGIEEVIACHKEECDKENMYDISVDSINHAYITNGIVSHNTTIVTVDMTHFILFNRDKDCAILANKGAQAQEIMSRIQMAYSNLPKWLQVGVKSWNKRSIELENGSKLVAASTSSDSVRGRSFAFVTGDTKVVLLDNDKNVCIENISNAKNKEFTKVLTNKGFKTYRDLLVTYEKKEKVCISLDNKITLKCTLDHKIFMNNKWVEAKDLHEGDCVLTYDGYHSIENIAYYESDEPVYDLVDVEDTNSYFTNGVLSHNCVFIDECVSGDTKVTVRDKITGDVKEVTMKELWNLCEMQSL